MMIASPETPMASLTTGPTLTASRSWNRDKAEADDSVTVRVMPFAAGAHRGLLGAFTLLEFDGGLPDVLYIDAGRGEQAIVFQGNDVVEDYRSDFAGLLEDALPADRSIYLLRSVAEEMS